MVLCGNGLEVLREIQCDSVWYCAVLGWRYRERYSVIVCGIVRYWAGGTERDTVL